MSANPPDSFGTPDGSNPSQWEEMMRSFFGDSADEVIAELKSRGMDPATFAVPGMPTDPAALKPLMDQVQAMLKNTAGGAVNAGVAHDVARQGAVAKGDPSLVDAQERKVTQALSVAELWLDAATSFPPSGGKALAMTRSSWVEATLTQWEQLVEPVAKSVSAALAEILKNSMPPGFGDQDSDEVAFEVTGIPGFPAQFSGTLGGAEGFDPATLMRNIGAAVFGMQIGAAAGNLSREVFGTTDLGFPLTKAPVTALVPNNIAEFSTDLGIEEAEVLQFLALREAAHARLFAHVPWLRSHIEALIASYARGISIDMDALEGSMSQIDPTDTEAMQEALSGGVFSIQSTEEQKATLARLETALALIEGWVDQVVANAAIAHLPASIPLREMMRRRRAAGGPAEQAFSALVGLELRPRRSREAAALWATIQAKQGPDGRDEVWQHPDLLPTAQDLDDPTGFFTRREEPSAEMSDLDAVLAQIFESADQEAAEASQETDDQQGTDGDDPEQTPETNSGN